MSNPVKPMDGDQWRYWRSRILTDPMAAESYAALGAWLHQSGRVAESIAAWSQALRLEPNHESWYLGALAAFDGWLQLPTIYPDSDAVQESRLAYSRGLSQLIDLTRSHSALVGLALRAIALRVPFYLSYQGQNDRALQEQYGTWVSASLAAAFPELAALQPRRLRDRAPGDKIRVGYFGSHFYHHSVMKSHLGWLRHADRDRLEIYTYYAGNRWDDTTEQARRLSDRFAFWEMGAQFDAQRYGAFCRAAWADRLDVAVLLDVGMDSVMYLLGGWRFAPIQCATWGHPVTTGLPVVDYYLSSDRMEPPQAEFHYSETPICLPGLGIAYARPLIEQLSPGDRASFGLPNDAVIYLCCQSLYKYLPQFDRLWVEIAQQVPAAHFVFLASPFPEAAAPFRSRLSQAFAAAGLKFEQFCTILPPQSQERFWQLNQVADLFLDAIGWSGCNSVLEAIACGLPVVTLPGELMRGRHALAILQELGLTETIATSLDDYRQLAIDLGRDRARRQRLSAELRSRADRLFEDIRPVRALEHFFAQAIERRSQQTSPIPLAQANQWHGS
jgi:predicted O-linked N-acetylglucosamine transferase (SPINDLY family)